MDTQIFKNSLLSFIMVFSARSVARTDANLNPVTEYLNECIKVLDQYNRRGDSSCSTLQPLLIDGRRYNPKLIMNPKMFKSPDEAAKGFQEFLKKSQLPQFIEYCAFITRTPNNEYTFTWYLPGSPGDCPILYYQKPPNTVANIHSHPHSKESSQTLDHLFNSPSAADLITAKLFAPDQLSYMIAPHGHIYRYGPDSARCVAKSRVLEAEYKIISVTRKNALPTGMHKRTRIPLSPEQAQAVCPTM